MKHREIEQLQNFCFEIFIIILTTFETLQFFNVNTLCINIFYFVKILNKVLDSTKKVINNITSCNYRVDLQY